MVAIAANGRRFLYWGLLSIFIYIGYLVLQPFLISLVTSIILAYIFYPLYQKFFNFFKNNYLASFLVSLLLVLLVTLPALFLLNSLSKEAYILYSIGQQQLSKGTLFSCDTPGILCEISTYFSQLSTRYYLERALENVTSAILDSISAFAMSIPTIALNLCVVLFLLFYWFIASENLKKDVFAIIPYSIAHTQMLVRSMNDVTYAIVYGMFVVAVIQSLLGILGFVIVSASSPVLWGLLIGFLAFIPFIGASVVWVPAVLIYLYYGVYWKAVVIGIFGIVISLVETLARPLFISKKVNIDPAIMFLGILGGLHLFGFIGLILGPLILSILMIFIKIYMEDNRKI